MRALPKWVPVLAWLCAITAARADDPAPLTGTKPLTMQGDLASTLVDGVDRFLLRKTDESVAKRAAFWKRDVSSPEKYTASVAPNRDRLKQIIGVRDPRVPFDAPELVGTTDRPALIARGQGYEVFAVRWPAFGDVHGEGLLLVPTGKKVADVVAIPDADQTPEQLVGLAEGVAPASQFGRLAESGCRVLVPVLVDRTIEPRNGRAKLTSREYLYRSAFELGRHIIGYEVQKVLAAVDWFVKDAKGGDPRLGVFGYGEGGLIAFYAGAVDPRIDAVGVSGYVDNRQGHWREPIDRNVFGFLEQFGDAEVASLIAPRSLTVETAAAPAVTIRSEGGAAPGRITTPDPETVRAELDRALSLTDGLRPVAQSAPVGGGAPGAFGTAAALGPFLHALAAGPPPGADAGPPRRLAAPPDPAARQRRQVHELDRHNQQLLAESPYARDAYFRKLDTKSLDAFNKTIEPYRAAFRDDVIGHFADPLLPPDPRTRRVYDDPKFSGYEVVLDVFPDVIAYGILLVPKGIKDGEKRPVVVCQHGLEGRPQDVADPKVDSPYYHRFAAALAGRGFVTFSPQNLYIFHDRFRTLQRKANPLKKTLFSVIVPQHQQITDWLKTLPQVDPARIGFYGLSYGGKSAMRIPPLVANYCLSICSGDFNEWVGKNASTRSPYSYVWTPEYEIFEWDLGHTFNYAEMAALIAPRPFMVERGHFDAVGSDDAVGGEFAKVRFLYEARLGIGDRCSIEWFTGPHTVHGVGTYDFLHKHLNWPKPEMPPRPDWGRRDRRMQDRKGTASKEGGRGNEPDTGCPVSLRSFLNPSPTRPGYPPAVLCAPLRPPGDSCTIRTGIAGMDRVTMRLSLQTDYALRTLMYLATRSGRTTVAEVAGFYGISAHHVGKVVHQLGRLGYVRNHRGPGGGITLAKGPAAISVGRIVLDFEGNTHLLDCVETPGVCVIQPGCTLRGVLAKAERLQLDYLNGVTLESLLPTPLDLAVFRA